MRIDATHAEATRHARRALAEGFDAELRALQRQRPRRRVAELAFFAALWAAAMAVGLLGLQAQGALSWPLRLIGIGGAAAALNAFYLLSHEGHHRLLFRHPAVNHAVNVLLCIPLLHSPTAYRVLHDLHHRYLGGPGDPDEYRNYTSSPRLVWALQWVRLALGTLVYMPLIPIVAWRRAGGSDGRMIALEYAVMTALWIPVFAMVPLRILLQVWLVPGVIVGYISAVRALAQHALTASHDPLLASRSVRSNAVVSFFLLNENFHLEHHLFPEVPSYNLPPLRQLLRSRVPHTVEAPSYARFLAGFISRCMRGDDSPLGLRRHGAQAPDVAS